MFGIDDSGMLKISWRTTSDMAKPQFTDPAAPNYTTVEASNGAMLDCWVERLNIRPWVNTLLIRVGRGYLRAGDTITVRFGDRREGSPGLRLQTNCEERFELKFFVDAFATYEFTELPRSPGFALVAGPAASWKAIWPSLAVTGEPFRLALVAEDMWGNPTGDARRPRPCSFVSGAWIFPRRCDQPGQGPRARRSGRRARGRCRIAAGGAARRSHAPTRCALSRARRCAATGATCTARAARPSAPIRRESYFRYARDKAFVDIVGHQGNDFQITDEFWASSTA